MPIRKQIFHPCVLTLLLLVTLTACSTVKSGYSALQSDYSSWVGHPTDELIEVWGQPEASEELGNDYQAYTWFSADQACRRTFTARAGTITGYSETDC